jgi:hypothetical protein
LRDLRYLFPIRSIFRAGPIPFCSFAHGDDHAACGLRGSGPM